MTRLTVLQKSLWLGVLMILLIAQAPLPGYTEESSTQSDQALIPELELIKEEETVSIASRHEQPISQAPANVYVITDEDIRQSGATDIPTILRRVPGLEVMQATGADFNVSMRGNNQLYANKLLVMIDGRSFYIDSQALVSWKTIPITLPEIKRIEVLKGPASATYGFNAFDGVINIITKSPEEMKGTTLQFGGGELGTITSAAIHAGTVGKFGYRLSVGRDQNQKWRARDSLAFRSHKLNLHSEYQLPDQSKLVFSGGLVDGNRFDGSISETAITATSPTLGYANASYERPDFFLRAWVSSYNDTSTSFAHPFLANLLRFTDANLNSTNLKTRAYTYNIETQHTLELAYSNRLSYGVNYRLNTLSSAYSHSNQENRLGFYIQDEWKATRTLLVAAGIRYDLHTEIHGTLSPRLSLIYSPIDNHSFRSSVSVAYRPPTLSETHLDIRAIIIPLGVTTSAFGSSNLDPEQIVSYDLGYQGWFLNHRLRTRVDFFFNHISKLIGTTSPTTFNGKEADIYGGEAGIEFLATHWLSGFTNFSYQEIRQTFIEEAVQRAAPRFKWNVGLRGEWKTGLSSEVAIHHYGAVTYPLSTSFTSLAPFGATIPDPRVGSYNLLNILVAYKFWQQKTGAGYMRDAEVAFSAFNALNDTHKEHPLGDTIGSRMMGWLTVKY